MMDLGMAKPKFICPKCGQAFKSVALYVEHVKVHPSFKTKSNAQNSIPCCFGCESRFNSLPSFQSHLSRYHKEERKPGPPKSQPPSVVVPAGVKCPCCEEQLVSRDSYLKHMTEHLRSEDFRTSGFLCPLCKSDKHMEDVLKFRVHTSRYHPAEENEFAPVSEDVAQCTIPSSFVVSSLEPDSVADYHSDTDSGDELDQTPSSNVPAEENLYPEDLVKDQLAKYYLKLESDFILPSSQVQDVSSELKLLSELSHHSLKTALREQLNNEGLSENVIDLIVKQTFKRDPIFNVHHKHEDVQQLGTCHLRQKFFKENYPYVKPRQILVGVDPNGKNRYAHYVSIRETLTALLKSEDVKALVKKSFVPKEVSNILKDYTDGTAYTKHIMSCTGGRCLQLHLFQDAFDFDAYGPSQGVYKINGMYYSLGNLPAEFRSKVDSILMTYLMVEKDMKPTVQEELTDHDKLNEIMKPLIEELGELKIRGIEIDGEVVPVCLLFLIGDSLGQHVIGGFVKNFNSEFSCRYCPISKTTFKATPHVVKPFRTPEEYDRSVRIIKKTWISRRNKLLEHVGKKVKRLQHRNTDTVLSRCAVPNMRTVLKKNISKDGFKKLCGLNFQGVKYRPSPFNSELLNFHVCGPSMPPCLAHDLFEGIVKTVVAKVLKYFITEKKWFDLETLNRRIKSFKCKRSDARDAPTILKSLDKLSGNAVENWNMLRLLPFIIGDLIQDDEDPMWQLLLLLKEICELVCAPQIAREQVAYLKSIVQSFLIDLKRLLPELLTPKPHYLGHYADLIMVFGPLIRLFTLRFESKHVFFKRVGEACKCFINITKTLSQKYMYRFAYDHSSGIIPPRLDYNTSKSTPYYADKVPEGIVALIPEDFTSDDTESLVSFTYNGIEYKIGDVMILDRGDSVLDLQVGIIVQIILHCQKSVHLIMEQKTAVNSMNGFYRLDKRSNGFVIKMLSELPDYYPLAVYDFENDQCITLKHSVTCMM